MGSSTPAPTVSSSSTLWATASKEWVIPAKPKPGRKPKKDLTSPVNEEEDQQLDSKGRRVQNRAAQRAFRERKQSQLAELQARVQLYEQGEIERNVALQNIAKRLKEENEKLRTENDFLKEKVVMLEGRRNQSQEPERKRPRDISPSMCSNASDHPTRKRSKTVAEPPSAAVHPLKFSNSSCPPSMASSPDSNGSGLSPARFESESRHSSVGHSHAPSLANILAFPSHEKPPNYESNGSFSTFEDACGFCNEETPCLCRELAIQQTAVERLAISNPTAQKIDQYENSTSTVPAETAVPLATPIPPAQISILDNLPAYQPPVPLRRKGAHSNMSPSFSVTTPPSQVSSAAGTCSGDPSNCMACADDSFGKAFCTAIGESAATMSPCTSCPERHQHASDGCCGDPANCFCGPSSSFAAPSPPGRSSPTIPTSEVWRALKAHPNVAFADLSLLADVVARRSKCTGPSVVITPALGSITPERSSSPASPTLSRKRDSQSVILTDPHARYRAKQRGHPGAPPSPPPRLVPQEILMRCGRPRVREVHADAVKEALRLLDAKFAQS